MELFEKIFDFNGDGELDAFEKASEFGMFMNMVDYCQKDELASAGLDINELDLMDDEERRTAIDDAGLDPDDYDF